MMQKPSNPFSTKYNITNSEISSSSDSNSSSEESLPREFKFKNSKVSKPPDKLRHRHASQRKKPLRVDNEASFGIELGLDKSDKRKKKNALDKEDKNEKFIKLLRKCKINDNVPPKKFELFISATIEVTSDGLENKHTDYKIQKNGKNFETTSKAKKVSFPRESETEIPQKIAEFQDTNASEQAKLSQSTIIRNKLPALKNRIEDKNNAPKFQNKNNVFINYQKSNKILSQNILPNPLIEDEYIKPKTELDRNTIPYQPLQAHILKVKSGGAMLKEKTNDEKECTRMREERSQILLTRTTNKKSETQKISRNYDKGVNSSQQVVRDPQKQLSQDKFKDFGMEIKNNTNLSTFSKQNLKYAIPETRYHSTTDLQKHNYEERDDLDINESYNKLIQWHSENADKGNDNRIFTSTVHTESDKNLCLGAELSTDSENSQYNPFQDCGLRQNQNVLRERKRLNGKHLKNVVIFNQTNPLIEYGKDISDLLIRSHKAMSTFYLFYSQWKQSRFILIRQFEELDKKIEETSGKNKPYQGMFKVIGNVASATAHIPVPYASTVSETVAAFSRYASRYFSKVDMDVPEIMISSFTDKDASSDLNKYGLLCNQQLEEANKLIERFYASAVNREFDSECSDTNILAFLQGVVDSNPKHCTYYKKLHKCFQELLRKESPLCKRFCEYFRCDSSNCVDVIGCLDWRFVDINTNNESLTGELEGIHILIQNDITTSIDLAVKIKNCIRLLKYELVSVERCLSTLPLLHTVSQTVARDRREWVTFDA